MLTLFTYEAVRKNRTTGTILEFGGGGLTELSMDELSVLTNLSTEAGAITGIIEPTQTMIDYLITQRNTTSENINSLLVKPDRDCRYKEVLTIDASEIVPMISLPSDPQHVVPLSTITNHIPIQKAFIGSCVGGKFTDLKRAADILRGKHVASNVLLVIHPASSDIYQKIKQEGIEIIFTDAGATILPPSCGACIGQGPGRINTQETGISTSNRNYPGRMGKGSAYLANPMVVAASAIAGYITGINDLD